MKAIQLGSLVLPVFAIGLGADGSKTPSCVADCTAKIMPQDHSNDMELLCKDVISQRGLLSCLAGSCKPDAYGPALIHTIKTCSDLGANISILHPVVLSGLDTAQASTAPEVPGMAMTENDCDDIGTFTFDRLFAISVDCHAGPDGVLTLSPPGATPEPDSHPDNGDSNKPSGPGCNDGDSDTSCPQDPNSPDSSNNPHPGSPGTDDGDDSAPENPNNDTDDCSSQDASRGGDGNNADGGPVATLRIPIPLPTRIVSDPDDNSATGGNSDEGPAPSASPEGGPEDDKPFCRPLGSEGDLSGNLPLCPESGDTTLPTSPPDEDDTNDTSPPVPANTGNPSPTAPSDVVPEPSASPATDDSSISPQGTGNNQPNVPVEPMGNGTPDPSEDDCDNATPDGGSDNTDGKSDQSAPIATPAGNPGNPNSGPDDMVDEGGPITPAGSGGPAGGPHATNPCDEAPTDSTPADPVAGAGTSPSGDQPSSNAGGTNNSVGAGDGSNDPSSNDQDSEDDGAGCPGSVIDGIAPCIDPNQPPNSTPGEDDGNTGPSTDGDNNGGNAPDGANPDAGASGTGSPSTNPSDNSHPGNGQSHSGVSDDSSCGNDSNSEQNLDDRENDQATEVTLWPHATPTAGDDGGGTSPTTFIKAGPPSSLTAEPAGESPQPEDSSQDGTGGGGPGDGDNGSSDPIVITVIAPAGQGGTTTTVVTVWPMATDGLDGQGSLKSYGDPNKRDIGSGDTQNEADVAFGQKNKLPGSDVRPRMRRAPDATTPYAKSQAPVETEGEFINASAPSKPSDAMLVVWWLVFVGAVVMNLAE